MTDTLLSLAGRIRAGEQSPLEAVDAALARIEATNGDLNAFCEVRADEARAQARAVAERLARGEQVGALAGVPIGVKDLENADGFRTTYGDPAHASDPPATRDSVEGGAAARHGRGRRRQDQHPRLRVPR